MKKLLTVLLLSSLLLHISCQKETSSSGIMQQDTIPVKIMKVNKDSIAADFETSGYFTTDDETPLAFKNGGIVKNITVSEGDRVKKGQLLAEVEGIETQSASSQAEENYQKAKRDYERAQNLYRDSVATKEQMEDAKTALEVAKQQKSSADFNQEQSAIHAKKDGYVLKKFVKEGQMVGPGAPVLLISGSNSEDWVFQASISDYQWASIKVGDSARVYADVDKDVKVPAHVLRKTEGVDPDSGGFSIQLELKDADKLSVATGLFGKAKIYASQKTAGWYIPYDALLDGDADSGYVFVTDEERQKAKKQEVKISRITKDRVLVAEGLENVEYIIISGSAYLRDGSVINIED